MSNKRIVYIERPQDSLYYTSSRINVKHRFYEFHDLLTDEKVYISFGVNTYLYYARFYGRPVFLRLEEYYHLINDIYMIRDSLTASHNCIAYFNAKPLSIKQIQMVKAEHAELFI